MRNIILALVAIVCIILAGVISHQRSQQKTTETASFSPSATPTPTPTETPAPTATPAPYAYPIDPFKERITKKHFADYFTPANSPVQPERFTGYHTGVDVEYTDTTADIPIYAIADCTVYKAEIVSGYGGFLALQCTLQGENRYVVYGHVRLSSLPAVGTAVKKGEQIGVLGTGNSAETDGERHHLHFAIAKTFDYRGYVQNESELSNWVDPLTFF